MNGLLAIDPLELVLLVGVPAIDELTTIPRTDHLQLAAGDFESEWTRQLRAINRVEQVTRLEMIAQLEAARREVIKAIRTTVPGDWIAMYQSKVLLELNAIIDQTAAGWVGVLSDSANTIYGQATDDIAALIQTQLIVTAAEALVIPTISPSLVQATADYYAAFITGVSEQIKSQITSIVSSNTINGIPLNDTINAIGRNLSDPSIFKSIRSRAETIARTETARVRGRGNWIGQQQTGRIIPGLLKGWSAAFINTRDEHGNADMNYGDGNEIPVGEPFIVWGEALQYPSDPAGSGRNTINCACRSYTVVPDTFAGKKR